MKFIRLGSLGYLLLCVVAFVVQCWFVSIEYWCFKTVSNIAPIIPSRHQLPYLSICFSLTSIIDFNKSKVPGPHFFDDQEVVDGILAMKTHEIFAATPNASDFLDMCQYIGHLFDRGNDRFYRDNCFRYFDVLKYQMLGYMCYRVGFSKSVRDKNPTVELQKVANSVVDQNKLFTVSLYHFNLTGGSKKFLPTVHVSEFPYDSRQFAMEFLTHPTVNNTFRVSYDQFRVTRLPPPYETMCRSEDPAYCYYDCLANKSMPLAIKPEETVLTDERVKLKIVTQSDRTDVTTSETVDRMKKKCREICGEDACHQEYSVTVLVLYPLAKYKLGFRMVTAANPVIQIIYTPNMVLSELLTIIGCLLGIWSSASVFLLFRVILRYWPGSQSQSRWTNEHSVKLIELSSSIRVLYNRCNRCNRLNRNVRTQTAMARTGRLARLMDLMAKYRKSCIFGFDIAIFGLFLYHIITLSELYFSYGIIIKLSREVTQIEQEELRLVLCFDVHELFKWPYPRIPDRYTFDEKMRNDHWTDLTLRQMFQLQFPKSKVINSCAIRNFTTNRLQFYSFNKCSQLFEVVTIYMLRKMCYKITPIVDSPFRHQPIRSAFTDPFTIYSVTSDLSEWQGHHKVTPIIFHGALPIFSRDFALDNYMMNTKITFVLTYAHYILHLLPMPYSTECAPKSEFRRFDYSKCIIPRTLEKLGHLPHSEVYTEPLDYKFLSYALLANKSISETFDRIESHCKANSKLVQCEDSFTKTISSIEYVTETNLTFVVQTPIFTTTHANAVPRVTFIQFAYESACCFTFWFGVSALMFNPFAYFIFRSRRKLRSLIIQKINQIRSEMDTIFHWFNKNMTASVESSYVNSLMRISFFRLRKRRARMIFYVDSILVFLCIAHIIYLAKVYFSYQTVIKSFKYADSLQIVPSSIVCSKVDDMIKEQLKKPVTVATVFNMTPRAESFLSTCGGRMLPTEMRSLHTNLSNYVLNRLYTENDKASDCQYFFDVEKFVMNSNICYQMKFRNHLKSIYNEYGTFLHPGTLYDFGLDMNRTFDSYMVIMTNDKPYTSRLFSSKIWSLRTRNEWMRLTYIKYTTKCLPFPYDQQDYPYVESDECISLCVAAATKTSGKVYPMVIVDDAQGEMQLIDSTDIVDPVTKDCFNRVYDECQSKCKLRRNCTKPFSYFVTNLFVAGQWPGLSFWVRRTDYPETMIEFSPQMRLCDLILDAGNIVGIWLGLCVLQVNPFKLLKKRDGPRLTDDVKDEKVIAELSDIEASYQTYVGKI